MGDGHLFGELVAGLPKRSGDMSDRLGSTILSAGELTPRGFRYLARDIARHAQRL
jgi:hypothetical protein